MEYSVITFYRYQEIEQPEELRETIRTFCKENEILGRILIAKEGINGAVSGKKENINNFKDMTKKIFENLTFREQKCEKNSYHKLVVRLRQEICTFGKKVDMKHKGISLSPAELKKWYQQNEDFVIIDARNDYEYNVGRFKNAIGLPIDRFKNFGDEILKRKELKNKKIVLYCTGGIRCEKASAYMKENGFNRVYHIQGGIINYVDRYPNQEWEGGLFVFDDRIISDIGPPIAKCLHCNSKTNNCINCHNVECDKLMIICNDCQKKMKKTCSEKCMNAKRHRPKETEQNL